MAPFARFFPTFFCHAGYLFGNCPITPPPPPQKKLKKWIGHPLVREKARVPKITPALSYPDVTNSVEDSR